MSNRIRSSRRTVLQTVGVLGSIGVAAVSTAVARIDETDRDDDPSLAPSSSGTDDPPTEASRYIGVVDRIVDGQHVVLLLEDCETVVDQLVVPVTRFDGIAEGDILLAVVRNDELLTYQRLPEKPTDCPLSGTE
ncbi:hypothetical protein [Natrinema salaciae]|uniref:Uncharacterized protein n=1 Tax=Natrinema salaciae TaxID=1186196 RepID=A0A1H9JX24_9EURY|nr:hypothetical protein [Natrinema salaciae]SEQ91314.1 hypothetical protein SAMN04489841_2715 [Natrinema salaciae]